MSGRIEAYRYLLNPGKNIDAHFFFPVAAKLRAWFRVHDGGTGRL